MAAGPVTVQVSTTRPPTGGLVGRELDQAGLGRVCPSTCTRSVRVRPDGICGDCGRRYPSPTVPVEAA